MVETVRTPRRVKNEERIILLGMMQGMKNKSRVPLGRNVSESPGMRISDGASIDLEKAHFTKKGGVWLHDRGKASASSLGVLEKICACG